MVHYQSNVCQVPATFSLSLDLAGGKRNTLYDSYELRSVILVTFFGNWTPSVVPKRWKQINAYNSPLRAGWIGAGRAGYWKWAGIASPLPSHLFICLTQGFFISLCHILCVEDILTG